MEKKNEAPSHPQNPASTSIEQSTQINPLKTYTVRSGTIDSGKDYEIKMAALAALRSIAPDVEDAALAFKAEGCSNFDDLVIYRKLRGQPHGHISLVQLKHQDKPKFLRSDDFLRESGKLSLKKYNEGYKDLELKNLKKIFADDKDKINIGALELILYTNRNVDISGKTQKPCNFLNGPIEIEHFLKTNGQVYTFDATKLKPYSKPFLGKLFLFVEQTNEPALNQLIIAEINKFSSNVGEAHKNFVAFMTSWAKGQLGGFYALTQDRISNELTTLVLNCGSFCDSSDRLPASRKDSLFDEIVQNFRVLLIENDDGVITFLKGYLMKWLVHEEEFGLSLKVPKESLEELVRRFPNLVYHLPENKIAYSIITFCDVYKALWHLGHVPLILTGNYDKIWAVLSNLKSRLKFVILSESVLCDSNEVLTNLNGLDDRLTELILNQEVMLQGRRGFKLTNIINSELKRLISLKDVICILNGDFNVGNLLNPLPQYYIPRTITKLLLDIQVFTTEELFFVACNKIQLKNYLARKSIDCLFFDRVAEISQSHRFAQKCLIVPVASDFNPDLLPDNTHLLKFENRQLEWIKSRGCIKNIKPYLIPPERGHYSLNHEFPNWLNIISGEPGMGKTVALNAIALTTPVDRWVLQVNLNDHLEYYYNLGESPIEPLTILRYFAGKMMELNRTIFEYFLAQKQVLILLDGFDEISPYYKDTVMRIIHSLEGYRVWVTTRPVTQSHVELQFNSFSHSLDPFTVGSQREFLNEYFGHNTIIVDQLVDLARSNLSNLMGIPLQTKMLAEVFVEDYRAKGRIELELNVDILYLYERFVRLKETEFVSKFDVNFAYRILQLSRKYVLLYAVRVLFDLREISTEFHDCLKDFEREVADGSNNVGIVISKDDGNLAFVHRTFAEYYAALWLSENYRTSADLMARLVEPEFEIVRNFFDRILAKKLVLHTAVLNRNLDRVADALHSKECEDKFGRTAFTLLASWSVKFSICEFNENDYLSLGKHGRGLVDAEANIAILLVKNGGQLSSFDYVLKNHCLTVLNGLALREKLPVPQDFLKAYLYYCVEYGFSELMKLVFDEGGITFLNDFRVKIWWNESCNLLQIASNLGNVRTIKLLLENGADVHIRNQIGYNALHKAAKCGDEEVIQILLDQRANVHVTTRDGTTALHFAAVGGNAATIKILLLHGASVKVRSKDGACPLHLAAKVGNKQTAELLLDNGADVNAMDHERNTALHNAVKSGQKEMIELLLARGSDVNLAGDDGDSALHFAVGNGGLDIIKLLLSAGVNINTTNRNGETPLHYASGNGQVEVVELLLEHNANVHVVSKVGASVLHYAAKVGSKKILELILAKGGDVHLATATKDTVLHYAGMSGNLEMVESLLQNHQVNIEVTNEIGETVLHQAASSGAEKLVELLLFLEADVHATTINGSVPLLYAADEARMNVAALLLSNGANVNAANNFGKVALHFAAHAACTPLVDKLLEENANVNATNKFGESALHFGVNCGEPEIVEILLFHKIDQQLANNNGETAFHYAIKSGHNKMVELLLNQANIQTVTKTGKTALILALETGCDDLVELILNENADVRAVTNDGETALHFAVQKCGAEIIQLLLSKDLDVNATTEYGRTPLHYAAKTGAGDSIDLLLSNGANPNQADEEGKTALHYATIHGGCDAIKSIISKGADVNAATTTGETALHFAAKMGNCEVVGLLLASGADAHAVTTHTKRSVLWYAVQSGDEEVVELILARDVDLNLPSTAGDTVLHYSAEKGWKKIVELLIGRGANVNARNSRGETVLHYAAKGGDEEVVRLLLEKEVDVQAVNEAGRNALYFAERNGNVEVVELLQADEAIAPIAI